MTGLILLIFAITVVLGVPMAFGFGSATAIALLLKTNFPLDLIPQRMALAVDSFVLLAIPLFILGGMLIPLDFFPGWLKDVSLILPFNYMMYAPARLFVQFDWTRWMNVTGMQALWLGVFAVALGALFRAGLRHVSINGG